MNCQQDQKGFSSTMSSQKDPHRASRPECDFERLNYYYGQMMVERDFRDQQHYYNEKRWMLNRYGIGWGVLHGLKVNIKEVSAHVNDFRDNPPDIEIEPGFALDQYGNEILVCTKHSLNTSELLKGNTGYHEQKEGKAAFAPIYIAVRYRECGTEPFRLPDTHCCDIDSDYTYSRTRETQEFIVSHTPWPCYEHELRDDNGCIIDCFRNLRNPAVKMLEDHPRRFQCQPIPLATLFFMKNKWVIDNIGIRPVAYSNYRLGELVNCMTSELRKVHGAAYDRRSFVPLLAQTIPGIKYRSGRTKQLENIGELPFRITTDGRYLWCTDLQLNVVHHIPVESGILNPLPPKIGLEKPGWGISYDGKSVWVTIPGENSVEKINVCSLEKKTIKLGDEHCTQNKRDQEENEKRGDCKKPNNPREIVFDGQYLWISHGPQIYPDQERYESFEHEERVHYKINGKNPKHGMHHERVDKLYLTRLDPFTEESVYFWVKIKDSVSPVSAMVFDGQALWIIYNDNHFRAIARRVHISFLPNNQFPKDMQLRADEPIELGGNHAKDIAYDGNSVWVTHSEGASKIDPFYYQVIAATADRGHLSSIAFDGSMMWMVQNRGNESELRQYHLYSLENRGGYEFRNEDHGLHIGRICFDGNYLWVTGNKMDLETGKGIIYRILP